mgnify:CR=1 FL=1
MKKMDAAPLGKQISNFEEEMTGDYEELLDYFKQLRLDLKYEAAAGLVAFSNVLQ